MLTTHQAVLSALELEAILSLDFWQTQYLGHYFSKKVFRVWKIHEEVYPAAIIKLKSHVILILCLPLESRMNFSTAIRCFEATLNKYQTFEINLPEFDLSEIQDLFNKDYKFIDFDFRRPTLKDIEEIETRDYSCYSDKDCEGLEEVVQEIYKSIEAVFSCEPNNSQKHWQQKFDRYQELALEYYKLLAKSDLSDSDLAAERIQYILQLAEEDEILSLFLNEVDNLVIQRSSFNSEPYAQSANCQKWAQVFKTHVDFCNQLDSEVSRLTTQISSLIEQLQDFKSSEVFGTSLESPQDIDAKVQSLEILKQAAEVEKGRRKIRECLKSD
jgi:hypothetical protein